MNGSKTLLKLKFTPTANGEAKIDVIQSRIADTAQETEVAQNQCDVVIELF